MRLEVENCEHLRSSKIFGMEKYQSWEGGWMDGSKNRFKDCLQQSKNYIFEALFSRVQISAKQRLVEPFNEKIV